MLHCDEEPSVVSDLLQETHSKNLLVGENIDREDGHSSGNLPHTMEYKPRWE